MPPQFRAEQIGSLLRPAELLKTHESSDSNSPYRSEITRETRAVIRDAIASAVQKQLDLSIRPLTSGEYERHIFYGGFFEKLQGFEVIPQLDIPDGFRTRFPTITQLAKLGVKTRPGVVTTGKIKHVKSAYLEEWETLKSILPARTWRECKITIPSPTWQHMQLRLGTAYSSSAYNSNKGYFTDLATAFAAEMHTLYDAGLRSIQSMIQT